MKKTFKVLAYFFSAAILILIFGLTFIQSSNISSEEKTGIGAWTEEKFVNQFKQYADSAFVIPSIKNGEFNTIMPWTMYGGMTEEDLKAIYAYLQTTAPINKMVVKFSPFATGQ